MKTITKLSALTAIFAMVVFVPTAYPGGQLLSENTGGVVVGNAWDLNAVLSDRTPGDGRTIIIHFGSGVDADRKAALMAAHDTWEGAVAIDFDDSPTFSPPGANLGDGFNTHVFNVILGGPLAVAPTITVAATGQILEGDVYYSNSIQWFAGSGNCRGNKFDVQAVTTHEFGHTIGLAHSGDFNATLFPSIAKCDFEPRTLEPDDEVSVTRVYGQDAGDVLVPSGGISGRIIDGADSSDGKVCGVVYAFSTSESPITLFSQAYSQTYSGSVVGDSAANNTSGPTSGFYQFDGLPDDDYFILLDATGNVINANQISLWCISNGEADFPQEFYSGALESNNEASSTAAAVTVSGGVITGGIDIITETGPSDCSVPADCDDADACTDDDCVDGTCTNTPIDCDDGDACTDDSCSGGTCFNDPINCDDSDPCTNDSCDTGTGCVNDPINCDDGDACTDDSCSGGVCSNDPIDCDDGEACTADSCNPATGCENTFAACGPADGCCDPAACTPANDPDCVACGGHQAPCSDNSDCCSGLCRSNGKCSKP